MNNLRGIAVIKTLLKNRELCWVVNIQEELIDTVHNDE